MSFLKSIAIGVATGGLSVVLLVLAAPTVGGLNGGEPYIIGPALWFGALMAGFGTGIALKSLKSEPLFLCMIWGCLTGVTSLALTFLPVDLLEAYGVICVPWNVAAIEVVAFVQTITVSASVTALTSRSAEMSDVSGAVAA